MPYLIVNPDNSIADIVATDPGGAVFIDFDPETQSPEDAANKAAIINARYGHFELDYINGAIVRNQARVDAYELEKERQAFIDELVENEVRLVAYERLNTVITSIRNANSRAALNSLRGGRG